MSRAPRKTAKERFWAKVERTEPHECWMFTGYRGKDGYGVFWTGEYRDESRSKPLLDLAHRWAYQSEVGPIPKGRYVLHTCDNPSCCNPAHLFSGTQQDNVDDCARKGRRSQTRIRKLTPQQREEIADAYAAGAGSQSYLARLYGVTQSTISYITRTQRTRG